MIITENHVSESQMEEIMRTITNTRTRNNPIATVIKNYINKKSGNVTASRNEIQRRFFGLDWKDQKKIMAAFLDSGASDRNWAYSRLLGLWDESFGQKVQELWETYYEEKCAWVIIRHFPKSYLKEHIDLFNDGRDYYFICRRLAADADFVIDKERLSNTDYLMALSHGDRHIGDEEATDILYSIVKGICFHWCAYMELSRDYYPNRKEVMVASDFANVSIALYYLAKMGKEYVVSEFHEWESSVQTSVCESDDYMAMGNEALSDYEYKDKMADIVQKYLYHALPDKYKPMTDEEFDKRYKANNVEPWLDDATEANIQMNKSIELVDEMDDDMPF